MPRVYIDGIYDLFHEGHRKHFEQVKNIEKDVTLIVGVISDDDATGYKRKPIFTEQQRLTLVKLSKNVDEAFIPPSLTVTKEFIEEHKIDLIYHAFANEEDANKQSVFYKVAQDMGIFKTVPYNHGISTTEIIKSNGWEAIWERKGTVETTDLQLLNGYEATAFDPEKAWASVAERLNIKPEDTVLEVGCGAGFVAQFIKNPYVGVDQSSSLINKHIEVLHNTAIVCGADSLPFADKTFDYVLCTGVLQYFPNKEYTFRAIEEMQRVAKKGIYIGSIRHTTHAARKAKHLYDGPTTHLCHTAKDFEKYGFKEQETFYSPKEYFCISWQADEETKSTETK